MNSWVLHTQYVGDLVTELEKEAVELFGESFPRDVPSRVKKLLEEVGELCEAIITVPYTTQVDMEVADVALLLVDILHLSGNTEGLQVVMGMKLDIIRKRMRTGIKEE